MIFLQFGGVSTKSYISTERTERTGYGVYMALVMTYNHVTQPSFSSGKHCSMLKTFQFHLN